MSGTSESEWNCSKCTHVHRQSVYSLIRQHTNSLTRSFTPTLAGKTKKAWWEKGTKQLKVVTPVWDPWDLSPHLQLNTAGIITIPMYIPFVQH